MLLTRFWFLLLAVGVALSLAAVALVRGVYERDRAQDAETLLQGDRRLVDEFLRHDARSRLDDLAPLAQNPQFVTLMTAAARRTENNAPCVASGTCDNAATIGTALSTRVQELNRDLGPLQGDFLLAVDPRGVVVGTLGPPAEVGTNLGGLPVVSAALRGYVRDDLWELSGRLFRVGARPVLAQGTYYVGAVVHGMELHARFVQTLAQAVPGTSLAVFGPSGMVASYVSPPEGSQRPAPPPEVLAEPFRRVNERADWRERGYTVALPVGTQTGVAVFSSLPGMAGAGGAGFGVARPLPVLPLSVLLHPSREDTSRIPFGLVGGVLLLATLLGWVFVWREHDAKRRQLHDAFAGLARPGTDRLDPLTLEGFARELAVLANEGIDEVVRREVDRSAERRRSMGELGSMLASQVPQGAPPAVAVPPPAQFPGVSAPPLAPPLRAPPPVPGTAPQAAQDPPRTFAVEPSVSDETAHWREVYESFLETRRRCNEPVENLTFEKFSVTLQRHKDALVSRTQCKGVRFTVYEKEGKATLKASPVR
jgi:hypothetical protein